MKHLLSIASLVSMLLTTSLSQVPNFITHSGYLVDSLGAAVNGNRPMTFRLYQDSTTALADWSETFPAVIITNGVYNVNLDVTGVDFTRSYWLQTEVEASVLAPRTRLTSVPYALQAISPVLPLSLAKGVITGPLVSIDNPSLSSDSPTLMVHSGANPALSATTGLGPAIVSTGTSDGLTATALSMNGTGITGQCDNGTNAWGVAGKSTTGIGVYASGNFNPSSPNTALAIVGGALAVSGAVAPAFIFQTVVVSSGSSQINNPLTDGDPNAMLLVTPRQDTPTVPAVNVYVIYSSGHWYLQSPSLAPGMRYNILVIKQM